MDRRAFLKNCLTVGAGCALAGSASSIAGSLFSNKVMKTTVQTDPNISNKTNILFLFADDMRFSLINALGIESVITPNLDSLVQNGVTFKNNFVMGGHQGAICQPSRAMMLTGRNLFSLNNDGSSIPTSHKLISETLQDAGYNTFVSGKWHNSQGSVRGFTVAKNVFFGGMSSSQYKTTVSTLTNGSWVEKIYGSTQEGVDAIYSCELFANTAIEFLESQRNQVKPFFAYVPFKTPHDPRQCRQMYKDMYNLPNGSPDPEKVKVKNNDSWQTMYPNFASRHPSDSEPEFDTGDLSPDNPSAGVRDEKLAAYPRVASEVLSNIRDYYATMTHLDSQIGRIIAKLDEIGQAKNTIIIFAADNGLGVGQHALMGKQNLYHHSSGVPLIFSGKGIQKGKTTDSYCYLFDIYPTICQLTGVAAPSSVQGMSLKSILDDQTHINRPTMYFSYQQWQRAVLEARYKLIEFNVDNVRHTRLFDMLQDPWEKNNLSANPEYASKVTELRDELIRLKNVYNDNEAFWNTF